MLKILDSTLREGLQSVDPHDKRKGIIFSEKQSLQLAEGLISLGVDYIELGSPIKSPHSTELIKKVSALAKGTPTEVVVHCRCLQNDIDSALETGAKVLNLYFNLSEGSSKYTQDNLEKIIEVLQYTREQKPDVLLRYSFEDTFRTPYSRISAVVHLIEPYVQRVGFPDTTGRTVPEAVTRLLKKFKSDFPNLETEVHFHNDLLLASANALAAIKAGVSVVDTTILGIGERNGIIPLSGLLALLVADEDSSEVVKKYKLQYLPVLDTLLAEILQTPIPLNMPISGLGYFSNTAGVHVNGFMENQKTYQNIAPTNFGLQYQTVWASSVIGKSNLLFRANEINVELNDLEAQELAAELREYAKTKGSLSPELVDQKIKSKGKVW